MDGRTSKKIQINGQDLGKLFLLNEPNFYQYYYLVKMTAIYAFKFGANSGECSIELAFSGKNSRGDDYHGTAFDFSIERLSRIEEGSKNQVKKSIIQIIQDSRDGAFKHVKQI